MTSVFISLLKKPHKSCASIVISLCERAKHLCIYLYFKKLYANFYFQNYVMWCAIFRISNLCDSNYCLSVCLFGDVRHFVVRFYATGTFFSSVYVFVTLLGLYCKGNMNEWNAVLADLYWLIVFTLLVTVICNTIKFALYHYECTFINTF